MNYTIEKIDLKAIVSLWNQRLLNVNSEYQRSKIWSKDQKRRFIDSVLRNFPIPLIYLHKIHAATDFHLAQRTDFDIIDGQQRIDSIVEYIQGMYPLFHPEIDRKKARFPQYINSENTPWGSKHFYELSEDLKDKLKNFELEAIVLETNNTNEVRDLFIRLQAGMPLNPQEKRDAWPGEFTIYVQKYGGKPGSQFKGHDFFRKNVTRPSKDRGGSRQLFAQIAMLYSEGASQGNWRDISAPHIDNFYYANIDFDQNSSQAKNLIKLLDKAHTVLGQTSKLRVHEAIHIIFLLDGLSKDYASGWEKQFSASFDQFRLKVAKTLKMKRSKQELPEELDQYWNMYVNWTSNSANQKTSLERRHIFFSSEMLKFLSPTPKDKQRAYTDLERSIIFLKENRICDICGLEILWDDLEIHHVMQFKDGGPTNIDNGVPVHKACHPKGKAADDFKNYIGP